MTYVLRRTRDGAGDTGTVSRIGRINEETKLAEWLEDQPPRVGWAIQVGSRTARSYSYQDYWQTTYVTEIIKDSIEFNELGEYRLIRFKTGNSEYEWKQI